jgi:3-hydroxyisobutyrate dehydrogenase
MSEKIAYLGMGRMGAPMAGHLARAGHDVRVWNRSPDSPGLEAAREAGCKAVDCIAEAVADASVVFCCVSDVPDVEAVLVGVEAVSDYAAPGTLIVDMSTIGPFAARELAEELATRDLHFVDAPVTGGDVGARNATLTIMVGAADEDFARVRPLLEVLGSNVHHCGGVGQGQAVKLCNQVLGALHMVALTEALELARGLELDPAMVVEVCRSGAAGSWALEHLGPRQIARDFAPGFSIAHLLKDLRLAGVDTAVELLEEAAEAEDGAGEQLGTQALRLAYE